MGSGRLEAEEDVVANSIATFGQSRAFLEKVIDSQSIEVAIHLTTRD